MMNQKHLTLEISNFKCILNFQTFQTFRLFSNSNFSCLNKKKWSKNGPKYFEKVVS